MDAKEELAKLTLGKIVTGLLLLIGFLVAIVWRETLFGKWLQVAEGVSKSGLMALLGLALIATLLEGLLIAYLLYLFYRNRRNTSSQEPTMLKGFGILWDHDQNPHCPADQTLMRPRVHATNRDYDILMCPKCDKTYPLRTDDQLSLLLPAAQNLIRQGKTSISKNPLPAVKPFRMFGVHSDDEANPLCPVCDCLMPIHHREGEIDVLWCPRCKTSFSLWEDSGERLSLETAKAGVAFYRGD